MAERALAVEATSISEPTYRRRAACSPPGPARVFGLGPGRFKIRIKGGGRSTLAVFDIESTGAGEIPATVDLR